MTDVNLGCSGFSPAKRLTGSGISSMLKISRAGILSARSVFCAFAPFSGCRQLISLTADGFFVDGHRRFVIEPNRKSASYFDAAM